MLHFTDMRRSKDLGDIFKYRKLGHDKPDGGAIQKDEIQDEDPAYLHKLLDWADDKVRANLAALVALVDKSPAAGCGQDF